MVVLSCIEVVVGVLTIIIQLLLSQVPSEVWLTGLVSLGCEVVRMGVKDLFTAWEEGRTGCYWAGRGAVWGVQGELDTTCQE